MDERRIDLGVVFGLIRGVLGLRIGGLARFALGLAFALSGNVRHRDRSARRTQWFAAGNIDFSTTGLVKTTATELSLFMAVSERQMLAG